LILYDIDTITSASYAYFTMQPRFYL